MKLLIATPLYPPDIGGPATYAKILHDELPSRGVLVQVVSFSAVRRLSKILSYPLYALNVFWGARRIDVVLALDPMHTGLSGWFAAAIWRKKFVVRIAGDYAWEQGCQRFGVKENLDEFVKKNADEFSFPVRMLRYVQTFVARNAEHVIVPSKYFKDIILTWGIPETKITVVYNAFEDLPRLPSREELRKGFGFRGAVLLSAGRLVPWKGFSLLISMMPEIRKHYPGCKLHIAGSGPLAHDLKKQVDDEGLAGVVTMLGDLPHATLMEYKYAADCFVLNTGYEGFSHHILEALAMGIPVITTNIGGNTELVKDGVTGLLVGYNDRDALKDAINYVLKNSKGVESMVLQGKKLAQGFTVDRMVRETLQIFKDVATRS